MGKMDDRERIVEVLGVRKHGKDQYEWMRRNPSASQHALTKLYAMADAVLDALGDRLLPELPEWLTTLTVAKGASPGEEPWLAVFDGYIHGIHELGSGPTIAGAIRDALGETEREAEDAQ